MRSLPKERLEMQDERIEAVLEFWFGKPFDGTPRPAWFEKNAAFDDALRQRFLADHEAAAAGQYDDWASHPRGALALMILLDQLPRNLFRGDARAFATDPKARQIARAAIAQQHDKALDPVERWFLYLPFEHSEDMKDQRRSMALFETLRGHAASAEAVDFARRHFDIVGRFGRFPHRNAALARPSTPEEEAFLKEPNSSF
jgi:uncharacterized protein (DUF924 family)